MAASAGGTRPPPAAGRGRAHAAPVRRPGAQGASVPGWARATVPLRGGGLTRMTCLW